MKKNDIFEKKLKSLIGKDFLMVLSSLNSGGFSYYGGTLREVTEETISWVNHIKGRIRSSKDLITVNRKAWQILYIAEVGIGDD